MNTSAPSKRWSLTPATDVPARERALLALSTLRAPAGYDLWRLTQPGVLESAPWHVLFPVAALSMIGLAVLAPFWPPAILLLIVGALGSMIARARLRLRFESWREPFDN